MLCLLSPNDLKAEQFEDILIYFSKSLLGKENEDEILWDLAKNCIAKLGFVDCVVYLIYKKQQLLVQKAAYGPKNPKDHKLYNPVEIKVGEGITGAVALSGKAEIIADTARDPRYIVDDAQRLSEICVPISHENIIYGVIDCEHPKKDFFTPYHLKMLSAIASICAIKIKSVRANKALVEKQETLLKIKEEMVELRLKALNSQLNPHFVFNVLNSIQYFVTTEDKKSTLEYLSIFSKLIRFHLKYVGEEVVELKDELQMLRWYLKLQKLRYDDQLEYTITVHNENGKHEALIPTSIIQTLIEDVIEKTMASHLAKAPLQFIFKVSKSAVLLEVHFSPNGIGEMAESRPRYGIRETQWLDQIRLLNATKNYRITKEESESSATHGRVIKLSLPNLG